MIANYDLSHKIPVFRFNAPNRTDFQLLWVDVEMVRSGGAENKCGRVICCSDRTSLQPISVFAKLVQNDTRGNNLSSYPQHVGRLWGRKSYFFRLGICL